MKQPRVVIVTGGGSGMGRAIAQRFAQNDDIVYVLGRRIERLKETAKGFPNIECLAADLTDINSTEKTLSIVIKKQKQVDVLINNAGGNMPIEEDATLKDKVKGWRQIIATNLDSVFLVTTAVLPHMKRPGGRIINITSTAALLGSTAGKTNGQAYSAAKAGIHGFSRTLMHSVAKDGITVNCVSPGVVDDTEFFTPTGVPTDRRGKYLDMIPIGRLGEPNDIAEGVFYLASEEAGFVNGEILNINGGMVLGR